MAIYDPNPCKSMFYSLHRRVKRVMSMLTVDADGRGHVRPSRGPPGRNRFAYLGLSPSYLHRLHSLHLAGMYAGGQ